MILLKVDRASMHQSVEVRVPLLDREGVDVAQRMDWQSCIDIQNRIGKIPLRRALARHVRYQTSGKRGFGISIDAWFRGPLQPIFQQVVLAEHDLFGLPVNQIALRELVALHVSGRRHHGTGLWMLLSLALWKKRHYDAHRVS